MLNTNSIPFIKLSIGGLGHPPATVDIDNAVALFIREQGMRWFDFWLKGIDNGITNEPPITIAPEDTDDWSTNVLFTSSSFPLPGTTKQNWYISGDDLKSVDPVTGKAKKLSPSLNKAIINDNATDILSSKIFTEIDDDAQKIAFFTDPLPTDLTVIGSPVVHLYVSAKK